VDSKKVVQSGLEYWLRLLEHYLDRKHPGDLTHKTTTPYSRQFKFEGKINVDMLVSPFWQEHTQLYQFLETISPEHWHK